MISRYRDSLLSGHLPIWSEPPPVSFRDLIYAAYDDKWGLAAAVRYMLWYTFWDAHRDEGITTETVAARLGKTEEEVWEMLSLRDRKEVRGMNFLGKMVRAMDGRLKLGMSKFADVTKRIAEEDDLCDELIKLGCDLDGQHCAGSRHFEWTRHYDGLQRIRARERLAQGYLD